MMNIKKGFTLIELVLVIIIILILFASSKSLFQTPNKYLIDSEVCINKINGQLSQFFYQSITGKDKVINGIVYEPDTYSIQIQQGSGTTKIGLYISTGGNNYALDDEIFISTTGTNIASCNTNTYSVIISGQNIIPDTNNNINIILYKNLNNGLGQAGMRICKNYNLSNPGPCTQTFSSKIDYLVCKKNPGSNIVDMSSCKHTFSNRFDTATQSIKSNRCLNIMYNQSCKTRAIDNF